MFRVLKRTVVGFYDDQMTHHAAALTYYALMSLFPALLLGVSLLGLIGQQDTYSAVVSFLHDFVPGKTLDSLDTTLRKAHDQQGTALTALFVSVAVTLYGTTGALEATRRALNVVFEVERGRRFLRRKLVDISSSLVLIVLVILALTLLFVGERLVTRALGHDLGEVWRIARWPGALLVAVLLFSGVYYVTPDVHHRGFRWVTPGATVGVLGWIAISWGFGQYISSVNNVTVLYGAFASAIVLILWLWLTNVCLLFGAELDAEIERAKELREGVAAADTLALPDKAPG